VYAAVETTSCFNSLTRRKAVETASVLLAFNTRLKAGVNENSPLTRGFDSR
jgi:hypothetical protein